MLSHFARLACPIFLVLLAAMPVRAQVQDYTPQQVYTIFYDSVSQALGFNGTSTHYLSLSAVGRAVKGSDTVAQISDLSNFCPPAKPILDSFANEPKLDAIYERILNGAIGPAYNFSQAYKDAELVIRKPDGEDTPTPEYSKYLIYRKKYLRALIALRNAVTPEERLSAQDDLSIADDQWGTFGFKGLIEGALGTVNSENFNSGLTKLYARQSILKLYRETPLKGKDAFAGDFSAPFSEFSPPPDSWSTEPGWTTLNYSTSARFNQYNQSSSEKRGFGGLNLGFLTIAGGGGSSSQTTSTVNRVSELTYQMDLLRVGIRRNWLDSSLFFDPTSWTWKKVGDQPVGQFPRVALALNQNGIPVDSQIQNYNNARVSFAMLPLEVIVARNVSVTATVSKSDYDKIVSQSSASGGATLFGIFGGAGGGKWSSENVTDQGNTMKFTVKLAGPVVIGYISQVLPLCPNPNLNVQWPNQAWKP